MKKQTESIILTSDQGQRLKIYRVDGSDTFCIGLEDDEHFEFKADEAKEIIESINTVVGDNIKINEEYTNAYV